MEAPENIPSPTVVDKSDENIKHQGDCFDTSKMDHGWNILDCDNVLKKIGKIGNVTDFSKLRHVDEKYYAMLNPTFFDIINPRIEISKGTPREINVRSQVDNNEAEPIATTDDVDMRLKVKSVKWRNQKLIEIMEIPLDKFTSYKHLFRCIYLFFDQLDSECNLRMIEICTPLQPYITRLGIMLMKDLSLLEFVDQFLNLRELEISDSSLNDLVSNNNNNMTYACLDELKTTLDNIKLKPKIVLNMTSQAYHLEVLTKFGARPNTIILLSMGSPETMSYSEILDHFQNISTLLNQFQNVQFDCSWVRDFSEDFDDDEVSENSCINNILHLQILTTLWIKYGKQEDLLLCLDLSRPTNFPDTNEVKECSIKLSPFLTDLRLLQWVTPADLRDIFSIDCEWPKLSRLRIDGYKHPLEILKKCPNLKVLEIGNVVQESCIFSNKDQSYKKNLQDYFGNLLKLEILYMDNSNELIPEENIIKFNELDSYLEGLFPKIIQYTNGTSSILDEQMDESLNILESDKVLEITKVNRTSGTRTMSHIFARVLRCFKCWPSASVPNDND